MGGFGSGRGQGGKDTTSDMRALDIRRLHRDGLLTPGRAFNWQWSINGETVADINIRVETGRVMLKKPKQRWRVAINGIPRHSGMDTLLPWWAAGVVSLPGPRVRAARGNSLRWFNLRLSALSQAGLSVPAGNG